MNRYIETRTRLHRYGLGDTPLTSSAGLVGSNNLVRANERRSNPYQHGLCSFARRHRPDDRDVRHLRQVAVEFRCQAVELRCQWNSGVSSGIPVSESGIPVSEHLFAWRTTTTARLTDDAEAMGNDLDPVLCTVGPATAHRRPHAIQLLGRLFPTDLPSPAGPTFRLSATELLPFRERVQDGIGMPGAMAAVARPGILARIGHHRGPHRVGLDVPQNDEQVVAVLDDRGSEAALPDVAAGSLSPVVPPGVSDGQGLEDAADRLPGGRLEKQMKMVGHQAVAEERERVPCLGAGEIAKEHIPFAVGAEDIGSVVPAVDRVVNKVIACRSWKSSHESNLPT